MADVTGPISTLPGSTHKPPTGMNCDSCGKPAVIRIQGETDSFGSEMHDLCFQCGIEAEKRSVLSGQCDWCKTEFDKLFPARNYDEGMCGPVYYVCLSCRKKQQDEALKEYNEMQAKRTDLGPEWEDLYDDVTDKLEEIEDSEDDEFV